MDNNFSLFTFSIFKGCTFEEFTDAIINDNFYKGLLEKDKAIYIPQDELELNNQTLLMKKKRITKLTVILKKGYKLRFTY